MGGEAKHSYRLQPSEWASRIPAISQFVPVLNHIESKLNHTFYFFARAGTALGAMREAGPLVDDNNLDVWIVYDDSVWRDNLHLSNAIAEILATDPPANPDRQNSSKRFTTLIKRDYFRLWSPQGPWVKPFTDANVISKAAANHRLQTTCSKIKGEMRTSCLGLSGIFDRQPCGCKFGQYLIKCPAVEFKYVEYCYGKQWRVPSKVKSFKFPC